MYIYIYIYTYINIIKYNIYIYYICMYTTCKCVTTATSSVVTAAALLDGSGLRHHHGPLTLDTLQKSAKIPLEVVTRYQKKQTFLSSWDYMGPSLSHTYLIITDSHTMEWWCNHCVRISPGSKSNAEVVNSYNEQLPKDPPHRSFSWRPCESPANLWGSSLVQLQLARREGTIEAHSLIKQALLRWSSLQEHDTRTYICIYI